MTTTLTTTLFVHIMEDSKFKTLSLVPCSQLLLMHWQIIMHGSAVAYKILFDQIIYLLIDPNSKYDPQPRWSS